MGNTDGCTRKFGEHDRPVRRLSFDSRRAARRVVGWPRLSFVKVPLDQMRHGTVVLAVRVNQSAVLGRTFEEENQIIISDLLVPVCHVNLERRKSRSDQCFDLTENRFVHSRHDDVEAVVDDRIGSDHAEAPITRRCQRATLILQREVHNGGHASKRSRNRPRVEVVRRRNTETAERRRQVRVRVDAAGHDPVPGGVDDLDGATRYVCGAILPCGGEVGADLDDLATPDQDVRFLRACGRHDRTTSNQYVTQVPPPSPRRSQDYPYAYGIFSCRSD